MDSTGNPSLPSTNTDNTVSFDNSPPGVTLNQAAGQVDPTGAKPILFTAVFTEPVFGFDASDVVLGGTAGASSAAVTQNGPMNGTTYQIAVTAITHAGTVTVTIPAGAATDLAGNPNIASTSTDNSVEYMPVFPLSVS